MKKFLVIKRFFAVLLIAVIGIFAAGCGEESKSMIEEMQSEAKQMSKDEAENTYSDILTLLNTRADLIPDFVEEEKEHSSLKFDEKTLLDVNEAGNAIENAETIEEVAAACNGLDEAIFHWIMTMEQNNPDIQSDGCYTALYDEISNTSERMVLLIKRYNNAVESYNSQVSSKEDKLENFVLPESDLITSETSLE